jgi:hypothetical protein
MKIFDNSSVQVIMVISSHLSKVLNKGLSLGLLFQLILRTYLEEVTEFLVSKLASAQAWMLTDLLWALSAVIYENGGLITNVSHFRSCVYELKGTTVILCYRIMSL